MVPVEMLRRHWWTIMIDHKTYQLHGKHTELREASGLKQNIKVSL